MRPTTFSTIDGFELAGTRFIPSGTPKASQVLTWLEERAMPNNQAQSVSGKTA